MAHKDQRADNNTVSVRRNETTTPKNKHNDWLHNENEKKRRNIADAKHAEHAELAEL